MKPVLLVLGAVAAGFLGLRACAPAATPSPDPGPTPTASPTPTVTPAATVTPAPPPAETGDDWTEHTTGLLAVRLPPEWRSGSVDAGGNAALVASFRQVNPDLVGYLGSPERLTEAVFSAVGGRTGANGFAENMNIRRMALDDRESAAISETAGAIAAQYGQLGFEVLGTATDLEIDGLPAARIELAYPMIGQNGEGRSVRAMQWLVAAPGALWILTYTTTADRSVAFRPIFEKSARSFEVR